MFRPLPIALTLLVAGAGLAWVVGPPGPGAVAQEDREAKACVDCHEAYRLAGTSHEVLSKTYPGADCTSCHGAGEAHAASPAENPMLKGVAPDRRAALCLSCHRTGPEHVTNFAETSYAREGKSCSDCHVVHEASDRHLAFASDEKGYLGDQACRMCHQPVYAAFASTFHAGVLGKPGGGCEACHGPGREHAAAARALVRGGGEAKIVREPGAEGCMLCHRAIPERHAREMPVYRDKRAACFVCHDVHVDRENPLYSDEGDPGEIARTPAGSEACARCHVAAVESMAGSVHAGTSAAEGCERCHGPAGAHVASGGRARFIVDPEKQEPAAASALCLSCHGRSPDHARDWKDGPLAAQGLSCLTCHEAHGTSKAQGKPLTPTGVAAGPARNVGSKACATCHVDPHPGIGESPHGVLLEDTETGCESCHGPGSAHVASGGAVERIRNPSRLTQERQAGFCLTCHGREEGLRSWNRGEHARAGLGCTKCHDPLKSAAKSSRKTDPELCSVCHQDVAARFRLPNHHPLDRGAVTCGSCHDPHGDRKSFLSLELRKERCFECHRNLRGPFLYEHEADRTDGCTICHMPHGSPNRRLLTHARVRDICIQCHVTPASHNLAAGSSFRNCLNCHGSIHGSYVNEKFFR